MYILPQLYKHIMGKIILCSKGNLSFTRLLLNRAGSRKETSSADTVSKSRCQLLFHQWPQHKTGANVKGTKPPPTFWDCVLKGKLKPTNQPITRQLTGKQPSALETNGLRKINVDRYTWTVQSPENCHSLKEAEENELKTKKEEATEDR